MSRQIFIIAFFVTIISNHFFAQSKIEKELDSLLINTKKGIYWGLMNIPEKKAKLEKLLIHDDRLIAKVKLMKEVRGIKIESTGYSNTNEMLVHLYISAESLLKAGFIKKGDIETYSEDD
jgi:hypothetical protein